MDTKDSNTSGEVSGTPHSEQDAAMLMLAIRNHIRDTMPATTSNIPLDICIEVAAGCRLGKSLTMKQLIYELPYSEAGIQYHLRGLLNDGWLLIRQSNEDRRVRHVIPGERLCEALTRFQGHIAALMNNGAVPSGPAASNPSVNGSGNLVDASWLLYQPVFSLQSGSLVSAEMLIREPYQSANTVAPRAVLPTAGEADDDMTCRLLELICQDLSRLQSLDERLGLSIKLTVRHLRDICSVDERGSTVTETRFSPGHVFLEITESDALQLSQRDIEACRRLNENGIRFAIDHWRIDDPSFVASQRLFSQVKLDVSWIENLVADHKKRSLVGTCVGEAHTAGMEVAAEGVQDPAMLELLRGAGCDSVQGHLLGRPLPLEDFIRFYGSRG